MTGWTPLHQRIVASSVWSASYHVRIAWVTLLAITGKDGIAHVTTGGLARLANIRVEEAADALKVLSDVDAETMTQANEGRRIERVDTGWKLLNWETYRVLAKKGLVHEQNRAAQARYRDKDKEKSSKSLQEAAGWQGGALASEVTPPMQRVRASNRPESVEMVVEVGKMLGVSEVACRKFWNHYEGSAREDASGNPVWVTGETGEKQVGQWRNVLASWKSRDEEKEAEKSASLASVKSAPRRGAKEAEREPGRPVILKVQTFTNPPVPPT